MPTHLNSTGLSHAKALVSAGKVNDGAWSFSADDGNAMLGPNGDNWAEYAKWFLAVHTEANDKTKAHWGYPFGKGGEVYRNAVVSAKGRAAQQGATDVENACSSLLNMMDAGKAARASQKDFTTSCDASCPDCGAEVCGMTTCPDCGAKGMTGKSNCQKCVSAQMMPTKSAKTRRAWSTFTIKAVNEDQRIIEGIASTPATDRMGDIVEPMGAQFKLPLPLLWQHDSRSPIGQVTVAKASPTGISITAQLASISEPGTLKDRLDEAWQSLKIGLVRGLSIGFTPIESAQIKDSWSEHYLKWDWLELSCVTIAANQDASILSVKSADQKLLAASGDRQRPVVRLANSPGASGIQKSTVPLSERKDGVVYL